MLCFTQVLNKVITVYAALCSEVKKLKYEVSIITHAALSQWVWFVYFVISGLKVLCGV